MFKTIEGIKVNGGPPGQAFGGGIYNASCSMGFSGNPTKISLNLVAQDVDTLKQHITNNSLNVTSTGYYDIEFGSLTFSNMMLYSYNFSDSATAKTATVNFVDWSIAMDKIFVGLVGRHDTENWSQRVMEVRFRAICLQCNSLTPMRLLVPDDLGQTIFNNLTGQNEFVDEAFYENAEVADTALGGAKIKRVVHSAGPPSWNGLTYPGFYLSENLQSANPLKVVDGGYVMVGREKFTETNCEIPKVTYTFTDLTNILEFLTQGQHNFDDPWLANRSVLVANQAGYEASYTGTLREVMSAWAADLSFDYVIDSTRGALPYLQAFDLVNPLNLANVKNEINLGFGNDLGNADGGLIRSMQGGSSLENSYVQTPLVKYIKPARAVDRESRHDEPKNAKIVQVKDAISSSAHLGRTDKELMVSMALAKYNSDARLLWLSHRAGNHLVDTDGDGVGDTINSGAFLSLGFLPVQEVTETTSKWAVVHSMRLQAPGDVASVNHPVWSDPTAYKLYVGIYNKQAQEAISRFDAELAEFLGTYAYFSQEVPRSVFDCPEYTDPMSQENHVFERYSVDMSTIPESELYSGHSYPFKNILRSNGGVFTLNQYGPARNVFKIEDNAWGTAQENVDWALENPYLVVNATQATFPGVDWASAVRHSDIENYVPIYAYFNNNRVLDNFFTKVIPSWKQGAEQLFNQNDWASGYMPGFALIPDLDVATGISGKPILKVNWDEQNVLDGNGNPIPLIDQNGNPIDSDGDGTPDYETEFTTEPNPLVFGNARRRRLQHFQANLKKEDCKTYCEENIIKEICECEPYQEPFHAFYSYEAPIINITHLNRTAKVIFPILGDYSGHFSSKQSMRMTTYKMQEVEGTPSDPVGQFTDGNGTVRNKHNLGAAYDPANVMATRIVEVDATPEIESLQEAVGVYHTQVLAQSPAGNTFQLYDLPTYYGFHRNTVLSAPVPTETLNIRLDGTEYGSLVGGAVNYLSPAQGLMSFSVSLDADGVVTDLTYSSRPPKLPKRDVMIQQIGPRFIDGQMLKPRLRSQSLF